MGMTENLKLKNFLPYRLSVLSNRISRDIARRYQERFNLTIPEWRVMAVLGEQPALSASEVADKTAMDKVAVSRAVTSLVAARLITRKTDRTDKRKNVLALTRKGTGIYSQVVPVAMSYETEILKKLKTEDQQALDRLLQKLTAIQAELKWEA